MIQLLLILGDNDYARAVILHVRALMYHEQNPELAFHDMFTNDVGTFSEEAGEIAISVTARYTLGDHTNDKLVHANKMFKSIGLYHTLCSGDGQLRDESCSDHTLPDLHRTLDSTTEYFRGVLRSLQAGTFVYYENDKAFEVHGHAHRLHREPPALVWRDVKPEIAKRLSTIDRTFPRHWGAQYADVMDFVLPERGRVEPQTDNSDSNMPDWSFRDDVQDAASEDPANERLRRPMRQRHMSMSRSPSGDNVSSPLVSPARPEIDEPAEPADFGDAEATISVAWNTPRPSVSCAPGIHADSAIEQASSRSSHSFEVGSSYENSYVQTATQPRRRRGRRRKAVDQGPFIRSPLV